MTGVDLSDPSGFNAFWEDVTDAFRHVAIDSQIDDGNLGSLNAHVQGPTTEQNLAAQYAFPIVWTVFEGHTPNYATGSTDQGDIRARVVTFASDTDPERALAVARTLLGRIVNNVEGNRSLVVDGDVHAEATWLADFDLDFRVTSGNDRAQVKYAQGLFDISVKRRY